MARKKKKKIALTLKVTVLFFSIAISVIYLKDKIQSPVYATGGRFGIQIDTNMASKVPSASEIIRVGASWVRFVWRPGIGIPSLPLGAKVLLIVNNESAPPAPIFSTDIQTWKNYIDNTYLPQLQKILSSNPNVNAIEVWNEEDLCDRGGSFCPGMPESAYAYLIKKAAAAIKAKNPKIAVIMGGLASGQESYIRNVLRADSTALNQVNAVGLHPYNQSPDGWCKAK